MNQESNHMLPIKDAMQEVAKDAAIASVASKWGMGGGVVTSVFGWFTSSGGAVAVGILVTILGFIINYIFQRRRDRREEEQKEFNRKLSLAEEKRRQELHEAQLRAIQARCEIQ